MENFMWCELYDGIRPRMREDDEGCDLYIVTVALLSEVIAFFPTRYTILLMKPSSPQTQDHPSGLVVAIH